MRLLQDRCNGRNEGARRTIQSTGPDRTVGPATPGQPGPDDAFRLATDELFNSRATPSRASLAQYESAAPRQSKGGKLNRLLGVALRRFDPPKRRSLIKRTSATRPHKTDVSGQFTPCPLVRPFSLMFPWFPAMRRGEEVRGLRRPALAARPRSMYGPLHTSRHSMVTPVPTWSPRTWAAQLRQLAPSERAVLSHTPTMSSLVPASPPPRIAPSLLGSSCTCRPAGHDMTHSQTTAPRRTCHNIRFASTGA